LVLRPRRVDEASIYRQLWGERDPRVPAHRRIAADGRPSLEDIASQVASQDQAGLLAVERQQEGDVIGYCGLYWDPLTAHGEAWLAFELLRHVHGQGYATEAGQAIVTWAAAAGYTRLWADVWDWNTASRRVLQKLGFLEMGSASEPSIPGLSLTAVKHLAPPGADGEGRSR
jgi:RimJ/RimL family protein N-acetyltransferase